MTRPQLPSALRKHYYGDIKPLVENDYVWRPVYRGMIASGVAVWVVAGVIYLFASAGAS